MEEKEVKEEKKKPENRKKVFGYHLKQNGKLINQSQAIDIDYKSLSENKLIFDNTNYGFTTAMRLLVDGKRKEVKTFKDTGNTLEVTF